MSNNLSVFHDFKNSIKHKKQLANHDWEITAKVIYKRGKDEPMEEVLPVYVRINDGKIALDEGEIINTEKEIHMDFISFYDNPVFSFSKGVLEIKGRSHPMYGSHQYEVIIVPL